MVTPQQKEKQIKVFGFGLPLLCLFLAWRHGSKHGWDVLSAVLIAIGIIVLVFALAYRPGLLWVFNRWMKVAGLIGFVVTTLILSFVYFVVFTPVALILRLAGKDYMQSKLKMDNSYWQVCPLEKPIKESMVDQF